MYLIIIDLYKSSVRNYFVDDPKCNLTEANISSLARELGLDTIANYAGSLIHAISVDDSGSGGMSTEF